MAKARVSAALSIAALLAANGASAAANRAPSPLLPAVHFVPGSLTLPPPGSRPALRDTCGAAAMAWLVGQPRSRIPVAVDLNRRRVSCTACVVAPDVKLDRLDILYDARTDRVTRIACG
jgi:hypothetical protein